MKVITFVWKIMGCQPQEIGWVDHITLLYN